MNVYFQPVLRNRLTNYYNNMEISPCFSMFFFLLNFILCAYVQDFLHVFTMYLRFLFRFFLFSLLSHKFNNFLAIAYEEMCRNGFKLDF